MARDSSFPEKPCNVNKLDRQWVGGKRRREKSTLPTVTELSHMLEQGIESADAHTTLKL